MHLGDSVIIRMGDSVITTRLGDSASANWIPNGAPRTRPPDPGRSAGTGGRTRGQDPGAHKKNY
jgi:hypothetical protein